MIKEKITFGIDRKEISHFTSITLHQTINDHHTFEVRVPHTVIEKPRAYTLENAQKWLGKTVHIALENHNNFLGIVDDVAIDFNLDHVGSQIIITGYSKTVLLESSPKVHSWEDTTLQDMVREVIKTGADEQLQNDIQPEFTHKIDYQTQYLETDFEYLQRLAKTYNEWLYYDGEKLFFGKPKKQDKNITLVFNKDLYQFRVGVKAVPSQFGGFTYNENTNKLYQAKTQGKVEGLPKLGNEAFDASEKLYNTASFEYGRIATGDDMFLESMLKKRQESAAASANYITATSGNNRLKIGSIITIDALEETEKTFDMGVVKKNFKTQEVGQYIITEITHKATDIGEYENSFKALPAFIKKLPEPQIAFPQAQMQQAKVIDNADPKGKGRIRVQMLWQQTKNLRTPWIRVVSPDAGSSGEVPKNRGMVFIPEIGDHVMLGFRYNDPNRPVVLGSVFSGVTGAGGGERNNFRTITDPSGHYLEFERLNNITLADKNGNKFHIASTDNNVTITALETLTLNAKNIIVNASENMTTNVGMNSIENVGMNKVTKITLANTLFVGGVYMMTVIGKMIRNIMGDFENKVEGSKQSVVQGDSATHSEKKHKVNSKDGMEHNSSEKTKTY
jgi:type VI secretion system secreted protein VgrG